MKSIIRILLCIPLLLWSGIRGYRSIVFNIDCGGRMTRAASANTVELALQEMKTVVAYAEAQRMTNGYTSILYQTPDEDVGFWYHNMKAALEELEKVGPSTSALEKSNILIKLRETVSHHSGDGTKLTVPDGLSVFPHNSAFCATGLLSLILAILGFILICLAPGY